MQFPSISGVAIAAVLILTAIPSHAEVVITLKNGVKITVPVNREDIATIELDGQPAKTTEAKAPPPKPGPPEPEPKVVPKAEKPPAPPVSAAAKSEPVLPPAPEMKKTKRVGLPEGSGFKAGAFAKKPPDGSVPRRVMRIGPGRDYERPSEYAPDALDGDIVEIEAGTYIDDFAVWTANYITLKGVGGRPHLKAEGSPNNGKAVWVIKGDYVTVENIEFSGVRVSDGNGGGIRYEGQHLTVKDSYFHHSQTGIMTVNKPEIVVEIENSEFAHRIDRSGRAHAIYIGKIARLSVVNSYFHDNDVGHHIKSRAAINEIMYNRITDEDGGSSYLIDLSNCGTSYIVGNVLQQSRRAENFTAISYGSSDCKGRPKGLYVINNTFINDRHGGNFLKNYSPTPAVVKNNIMVGGGRFISGNATEDGNIVGGRVRFRDRDAWDLRLTSRSDGINEGVAPGKAGDFDLTPLREPGYPNAAPARKTVGKIDAGAFESPGN